MNPVNKILGQNENTQVKPIIIGKEGTIDARAACPKCHRILRHSYSGPYHHYFCEKCDYDFYFTGEKWR